MQRRNLVTVGGGCDGHEVPRPAVARAFGALEPAGGCCRVVWRS